MSYLEGFCGQSCYIFVWVIDAAEPVGHDGLEMWGDALLYLKDQGKMGLADGLTNFAIRV